MSVQPDVVRFQGELERIRPDSRDLMLTEKPLQQKIK